MTYEDFWERSPALVKAYREAERIKIENTNTFEWLQGKYFYDALQVALANFSAGMSGKTGKNNYPQAPHRITPKTEEEIKAEKQRKLDAYRQELLAFKSGFEARQKENRHGRNG